MNPMNKKTYVKISEWITAAFIVAVIAATIYFSLR